VKRIIPALLSALLCAAVISGCVSAGLSAALPGKESKNLTKASNSFAFEIFKALNEEDAQDNVFISPLSISSALAMTLNGAAGTTQDAMKKALSFGGMTAEEINQGYRYLYSYFDKADKKVQLKKANSIWIREGFAVKPDFVETNKKFFDAEVSELDFDNPKAADTINEWIENATNKLIPKVIEPPIDNDVMLYLINAIYFKGDWTKAFSPKKTEDANFYCLDGSIATVPMMNRKDRIDYYDGEGYKAVRLPYGNGKVSMVCFLPDKGTDINDFIDGMTVEKWEEAKEGLKPEDDLILGIPRFKMEYGVKELNHALSNLGMEEAFSQSADFSGIARDLYISSVLHKAVIDVNEKGTEAAGVTTVEMKVTSFKEPVAFIADRPFVFIISDEETGSILFMGKKVK
jgi:serine protease inhibitor